MLALVLGLSASCSKNNSEKAEVEGLKFNMEKSKITGDDANVISFANDTLKYGIIPSDRTPGTFAIVLKVPVKLNQTVDAKGLSIFEPTKLRLLDNNGNTILADGAIFGSSQVIGTEDEKDLIAFLKQAPGATFELPYTIYEAYADEETANFTLKEIKEKLDAIKITDFNLEKAEGSESVPNDQSLKQTPDMNTPAATAEDSPNKALLDELDICASKFIDAYRTYGEDSPEVKKLNEESIEIMERIDQANLTPDEQSRLNSIQQMVQMTLD